MRRKGELSAAGIGHGLLIGKQTSMADSEKGGTHFGFVLYDQKGDPAYRSGTPMTRKLSRAETSGGDAFSVARPFVISAEDARPLIAEVALYYARTLIASALSHARNAVASARHAGATAVITCAPESGYGRVGPHPFISVYLFRKKLPGALDGHDPRDT